MEEIINVKVDTYWDFRKLLKLSYQMGFRFDSKRKYNSINLWFGLLGAWCDGLSFYPNNKMKHIERNCKCNDAMNLDEYLRMLHGLI